MHQSVIPARAEIHHQWTSSLRKAPQQYVHYHHQQDIVIKTFEPRMEIGLSGQPVDLLIEKMGIKLVNRNRETTRATLQTALANIAMSPTQYHPSIRYGFLYSASNTSSEPIARYKAVKFGHKTFVDMLKRLADIGFLRVHKGFKGKRSTHGLRTLWLVTDNAKEWLAEKAGHLSLVHNTPNRELLVLNGDSKELLDYEDNNITQSIRQTLLDTNAHRQAQRWEYTPVIDSECDFESGYLVFSNHRRILLQSDLECRRVFRNNFRTGGRFYCPAQGVRKDERMTMTVNGECCVELDIKCLHPRLLYNMSGLECPEDCYYVDGYDESHRHIFKYLCQLLINSESEGLVIRNLTYRWRIDSEQSKQYVQAFMRQHTAIQHKFFDSYWGQLQYADSQLTEVILKKCLEADIPVLPVHDSYITSTRYCHELSEIIEEAYYSMFKFNVVHDIQVSSPTGISGFNGQEVNQ